MLGANIIIGSGAPISALIDAIGQTSAVMVNAKVKNGIALPSLSIAKGKHTVIVIGADESVVADAVATNALVGAYYNLISSDGVSPFFNGCIASSTIPSKLDTPVVVSQDKSVVPIVPNNMAFPATHIVFYEKGAITSKVTEEVAAEKIVALSDDSKVEVAKSLVKGVNISTTGNFKDILALL